MSKGFEDPLKYYRNYVEVAKRVREIVSRYDPEAEVYVFGSVVRGSYTAGSDIDILVVTKRFESRYDIMVDVYKQIDAPIELHVVTRELFEKWYKRFISPEELVKIL
ncbi:nucleotidyltransferase domain-containing protein [Thermogladius sp. 4427co]|uniref:nucleotidyltransferase domain-containing protein n=1 Tax=Thermogladius sp. 4427co TaxID=3450718 RepID=UPI003F794459